MFDLPTPEALTVTLVVTAARTLVESSPTILGGVVIAAFLRTQIEPERMRELFRGDGAEGARRAALLAIAMPVCSIGVLPVLRELRRMGLPLGKLAAVALAAPLINPLTIFYGLNVLSPVQILMAVSATGLAAIVAADVGSRFFVPGEANAATRPVALSGGTRLRNLGIASGRLVCGPALVDLLVVIGVTALVASVLPSEAYGSICGAGNHSGPALAALLSLPQYVSPSRGVVQFGGIENANLSVAAGLALYLFGAAFSAASILAFSNWLGARRVSALLLALLLVIGAVSYLWFAILPAPLGEVGEATVLAGMTRPASATLGGLADALQETPALADPLALASAAGVSVLFLTGLAIRLARVDFRNDKPEEIAQQKTGRLSKAIPASQLGATAVAGIGLIFFVSVYMFYPAPRAVMELMDSIRLDTSIALIDGDAQVACDQIDALDSAAASIPVAAAIRGAFPTLSQRKLTRDLRAGLRTTRDLLVEGELTKARKKFAELRRLQSEAKKTFAGGSL